MVIQNLVCQCFFLFWSQTIELNGDRSNSGDEGNRPRSNKKGKDKIFGYLSFFFKTTQNGVTASGSLLLMNSEYQLEEGENHREGGDAARDLFLWNILLSSALQE